MKKNRITIAEAEMELIALIRNAEKRDEHSEDFHDDLFWLANYVASRNKMSNKPLRDVLNYLFGKYGRKLYDLQVYGWNGQYFEPVGDPQMSYVDCDDVWEQLKSSPNLLPPGVRLHGGERPPLVKDLMGKDAKPINE